LEPVHAPAPAPAAPDAALDAASGQSFERVPDLLSDRIQHSGETPAPPSLASTLLPPESPTELDDRLVTPTAAAPPATTDGELITLNRNVHRWRGLAVAASAIAVLLAIYIGVAQF